MSEIVIYDSSVLIDQIRTNCHLDRMRKVAGLIRSSSVVLAELWRAASSRVDRNAIEALEGNHAILTPTAANWLESGQILARIRTDKGYDPKRLRDLHFDVLIALTARVHGARLITSNRRDFELIREYRNFNLEVW
jgi:predicted nucleic acid-binding protein